MPPKPAIYPRDDAFLHAMPAYIRTLDVAGIKWIGAADQNKAAGLPYLTGLIVINDPVTAMPLAVMDAAEITAIRTAAASGVCITQFAPEGWNTVAIVGCGEQGKYHAQIVQALRPTAVIQSYDRHPERAASVALGAKATASAQDAVNGADVVITAIPFANSSRAEISPSWLTRTNLILPIDFDASVSSAVVSEANLFTVDSLSQFDYFRTQGHFKGWPNPHSELGSVLDDSTNEARVVCCNLGIGALDVAFADLVYQRAIEAGVGLKLNR